MKELIQASLRPFGYKLARLDRPPSSAYGVASFFRFLRSFGFAPRHIIDVGANKGNWTRAALKYFPDAYYTLLEPQEHLKIHIQDLLEAGAQIEWISAGAGDVPGSLPFTVSYRNDSSSFLPSSEQACAGELRRVAIPVKTLNQIAVESKAPAPDMVKIDAEGYDLKVLEGASELFSRTDIFLVEAAVCEPHFPNTLAAVIQKMSGVGYRLIDITDLIRSPKHGVLWLCEAAFLRNASHLLDRARSYE